VGATRLRAERFGHIALPAPVPHPWLEEAIVAKSGMDRRTFDAVYEGSWAVVDGEPAAVTSWMDRGVELERDALWGPWALRERSDRPDWWIDVLPVLPPALRENVDDREDRQPDVDALCARARLEGWNLERPPPPDAAQLVAPRAMDKLLIDVVRAAQRLRESVDDDAPMVLRAFEARALRESLRALFGPPTGARRSGRRLIDLCSARARAANNDGAEEALVALDRTLFAAGFARLDAAPAP
jgi:DNA-directed RNA polymerase beta' subunit